MRRFYHTVSGLATPCTYAYRRLPGGGGRFLRCRYWFGVWFRLRAVCRESVRTASIGGAWEDWSGASHTECPRDSGRPRATRETGTSQRSPGLAICQTAGRRRSASMQLC
jgi:hypothetical protein